MVPFDDLDARRNLLSEIFGKPVPDSLSILPPLEGAGRGSDGLLRCSVFRVGYGPPGTA